WRRPVLHGSALPQTGRKGGTKKDEARNGRATQRIQNVGSVTASAATAATTAVPAAATPATAATTATRTFFTGPRDVDCQGASAQFLAIQSVNGLLSLLRGAHGNEAETPRTASCPIHHEIGFDDRAMCRKSVLQV